MSLDAEALERFSALVCDTLISNRDAGCTSGWGCDSVREELADRAGVFLVNACATLVAVFFDVRRNDIGARIQRGPSIGDGKRTGKYELHHRERDYPQAT
jgi:hypothetical protein